MNLLSSLFNLGVRPEHDVFEKRLVRAVNILGCFSILSVTGTAIFGFFFQHNFSSVYILFGLPVFISVLVLNYRGKTMLSISLLFIISAIILGIYSIRTTEESYTHSLFILNIIGLSLLYKKERARNYLYVSLGATILAIIFVLLAFHFNWFTEFRDPLTFPKEQRRFTFVMLIICSIVFSVVVVVSYNQQHRAMENSLEEQRVLLAEVNHRVKNNMAVIISLINLQRSTISNLETKEALREIHDRIMAMALVHQKMYENKSKSAIDIGAYINELVGEIRKSLDIRNNIEFEIEYDAIKLDFSKTIPLGLILNELITNSVKHAFVTTDHPKISISMKSVPHDRIQLIVSDNGVGFNQNAKEATIGLGISLIESLAEQLDGKWNFEGKNGFVFRLTLPEN